MQDAIAIRYVRALLQTNLSQEVASLVLGKAGISEAQLLQENTYVSVNQYARLMRHLLLLMRDESFGFTRTPIKPGSFAMMCQCIMHATQLEPAIKTCFRFYRLISNDFSLLLRREAQQAVIELQLIHPLNGPQAFFTEASFAMILRLFSWLIDRSLLPSRIDLAYPLQQSGHSFEARFAGLIHYNQATSRLYLPAHYLLETIKRDRDAIHELLDHEAHRFLRDFIREDSYAARVQQALRQENQALTRSLESIARDFGISASSLRRKLREEGANFHQLRDQMRKLKSMYLLNQTHTSIDAIAFAMGYSESSTFHRAFKKWTGLTPQNFRRQQVVAVKMDDVTLPG